MYKSISTGGVAVYQAAGGNTSRQLPDWIEKKRKRALKNDLEYQNRVTLIQDFEFSEASNKIKVTPDGKFAMATGTYKPQIHVYDFENASLKFERHTDCENVDFIILSDDWSKSVHLQNDRSIQFQIRGGLHYTARIPKFGRAMSYNHQNCDLYLGASGNELYRLNLEQGRFLQPFELDTELGCNALDLNKMHGLLGAGLEDGTVEFWDPRSRQRVAKLLISDQLSESTEITNIAFRNDGLNMACGTSTGKTLLYDLRKSQPYLVKDQGYGNPIKKIIWLDENSSDPDKIMTADKRIAKIWERHDGKPFASMEPSVDINDVEYLKDSGMFFMANEGIDMHAYYIPDLGPAPKWVPHLDSLIEEEKPSETVYSKYRFITRKDVAKLNLSHLIGTKVMRSYMHGFFIDNELYDRANLIANPNAFRDQREREIKKKIEEERESRIRSTGAVTKTKVKVNKDLAAKLQKGSASRAAEVLNDERFKEMFEDPDFQIDTESHEYKQLNPVLSTKEVDIEERRPRGKTNAEESDDERMERNRYGLSASEDESESDSDNSESSDDEEIKEELKAKQQAKIQKQLEKNRRRLEIEKQTEKFLSEMKPIDASTIETAKRDKHNVSFGAQAKKLNKVHKEESSHKSTTRLHKNAKGELELTFVPSGAKKDNKKKVHFDHEGSDDGEKPDHGRSKQRFDGRRRASKNAFRGM